MPVPRFMRHRLERKNAEELPSARVEHAEVEVRTRARTVRDDEIAPRGLAAARGRRSRRGSVAPRAAGIDSRGARSTRRGRVPTTRLEKPRLHTRSRRPIPRTPRRALTRKRARQDRRGPSSVRSSVSPCGVRSGARCLSQIDSSRADGVTASPGVAHRARDLPHGCGIARTRVASAAPPLGLQPPPAVTARLQLRPTHRSARSRSAHCPSRGR